MGFISDNSLQFLEIGGFFAISSGIVIGVYVVLSLLFIYKPLWLSILGGASFVILWTGLMYGLIYLDKNRGEEGLITGLAIWGELLGMLGFIIAAASPKDLTNGSITFIDITYNIANFLWG